MSDDRRRFDPELLRAIRDEVDLVGQISRRVKLVRKGRRHTGLCPFHHEKTPSFTVYPPGGGTAARYHCFGCGAHGDVIQFVREQIGLSFVDAVEELARHAGYATGSSRLDKIEQRRRDEPARQAAQERAACEERARFESRLERARRIWRQAVPVAGTLAEVYLRARGLDPEALGGWPPTLRFAEACFHDLERSTWPALIAAVQAPAGHLVTVHRTYLRPDGSGKARVEKAKLVVGSYGGGAIRLTPADPVLVIGEGIETCLSALEAERRAGRDTAVWCGVSLSNIAGGGFGQGPRDPQDKTDDAGERKPRWKRRRLPSAEPDPARPGLILPDWAETAIQLEDQDSKDPRAADRQLVRAAKRWRGPGPLGGRRVLRARPGEGLDVNDLHRRAA